MQRQSEVEEKEKEMDTVKADKVLVVLSGGIDSTTLLYKIVDEFGSDKVYALTVNYGQKHVKEVECAKWTCNMLEVKHKVINLPELKSVFGGSSLTSDIDVPHGHYEDESMKITVVPNRNMVLLSLAISYAISIGIDTVLYAAHSGDSAIYPDCRPDFVIAMNAVATKCHYTPVYVEAPFIYINKSDIVEKGWELGVDYERTWTCYEGKEEPCLKCGACVERIEAFMKISERDPLVDESKWKELVEEREFYELVYAGNKVEALIKNEFPSALFTDASDDIHLDRFEVRIPLTSKDEFYPFAIKNKFGGNCFTLTMIVENLKSEKDQQKRDETKEKIEKWVELAKAR